MSIGEAWTHGPCLRGVPAPIHFKIPHKLTTTLVSRFCLWVVYRVGDIEIVWCVGESICVMSGVGFVTVWLGFLMLMWIGLCLRCLMNICMMIRFDGLAARRWIVNTIYIYPGYYFHNHPFIVPSPQPTFTFSSFIHYLLFYHFYFFNYFSFLVPIGVT